MHRHPARLFLVLTVALMAGLAETPITRGQAQPQPAVKPFPIPIRRPVMMRQPVNPVNASIETIFVLSMNDGHLTLTPGPAAGMPAGTLSIQRSFNLDGMTGAAQLLQAPQGGVFNFNYAAADDQQKLLSFSVTSSINMFSLSGAFKTGNKGTREFQLQENTVPGRPGVQMQITEDNGNSVDIHTDQLNATDFKSLMANYPRETNDYLRPVFEAMHQYDLLKYDLTVMSQVFLTEMPPDDKIHQQVYALLPKLGAEEYQDRSDASAALSELGTPGAVVLAQVDRTKLSPEQDARVTALLTPYRTLGPNEVNRLKSDRRFLLQCMDSDQPELRALAHKHLEEVLGRKLDFDDSIPADARHKAVALLEDQLLTPATRPATTEPAPTEHPEGLSLPAD